MDVFVNEKEGGCENVEVSEDVNEKNNNKINGNIWSN